MGAFGSDIAARTKRTGRLTSRAEATKEDLGTSSPASRARARSRTRAVAKTRTFRRQFSRRNSRARPVLSPELAQRRTPRLTRDAARVEANFLAFWVGWKSPMREREWTRAKMTMGCLQLRRVSRGLSRARWSSFRCMKTRRERVPMPDCGQTTREANEATEGGDRRQRRKERTYEGDEQAQTGRHRRRGPGDGRRRRKSRVATL